jgi:N-methylhydantoinase B
MTTVAPTAPTAAFDNIGLEVFRSRLQATAEEGAITIERTAISPVISESRDYSCTLLEPNGDLIVAGGSLTHHFGVCGHAVRTTLQRYEGTIRPGDMFFANDPHDGGGLHAQDVLIQLPVFCGETLIAWVVNSGHMLDMGGMVFGSWSSDAVDCYQEALRLPPVHLARGGEEQSEIWSIILNNVRVRNIVEMDMRSLVAGCTVAAGKLVSIASDMGVESFLAGPHGLSGAGTCSRSPAASRSRGDRLHFDFTGAPPQTDHFFNSKPHVIRALLVGSCTDVLTFDLPLTEGMFAPIQVTCPAGTIVNSEPPAPVASEHIDVAENASLAAQQCLMLALAPSPPPEATHLLCGPLAVTAMALHVWSYMTPSGAPDGWMMLDGGLAGNSAGYDRDGSDFWTFMIARKPILEAIDVEMLESWHPILVDFKQVRRGAYGAGRYRSGAGCHMTFRPHQTAQLTGSLLAIREEFPIVGTAGGQPGATSEFLLHRADGRSEALAGKSSGIVLGPGDSLEFCLSSGGGHGDPLGRDPATVAQDVLQSRLSAEQARSVYGVVLASGSPDAEATSAARAAIKAERLRVASPPAVPLPDAVGVEDHAGLPLYPGIEQRGRLAVASASGAVLAVAPEPWTSGCPVIERKLTAQLVERTYLDPLTGTLLLTDVVPAGANCSLRSEPARWTVFG